MQQPKNGCPFYVGVKKGNCRSKLRLLCEECDEEGNLKGRSLDTITADTQRLKDKAKSARDQKIAEENKNVHDSD